MDIIIYSLIILYKMYNYLYIKFEEKQIKKYISKIHNRKAWIDKN